MLIQNTKRPVIHLHIPKTGGQTFGQRIAKALPEGASWFDRGDITGENVDEVLGNAISSNMAFLSAHVVGSVFANELRFDFLTLVRDPVQQIISNLAHISREPENLLYPLTQHLSPIEVIQAVPDWFFNTQSRYLVTAFTPRNGADILMADDCWLLANLQNAITRLEWLGTTEKLDDFFKFFVADTGLNQPPLMASRNHAPNREGDQWDEVRDWLYLNSHRYAIDSLLYGEARRRFDEHCNRFWHRASRGDKRFAAFSRDMAVAYASDYGEIKFGSGWSFRELSTQIGPIHQAGPKTDSYLNLANVSGRMLSFKIVFVAGIQADEIAFYEADTGSQLAAHIRIREGETHVYVELPKDQREVSILVRSPRAIPLCVFNGDWAESRSPVPFAASSWSLCNHIELEKAPGVDETEVA